MKLKNLVFQLIIALLILHSCSEDKSKQTNKATITQPAPVSAPPNVQTSPNMTPVSGPPSSRTNEPPQNSKGVWHFTCPKGCPGGSGESVPCPKCGTLTIHNQAYHEQ